MMHASYIGKENAYSFCVLTRPIRELHELIFISFDVIIYISCLALLRRRVSALFSIIAVYPFFLYIISFEQLFHFNRITSHVQKTR